MRRKWTKTPRNWIPWIIKYTNFALVTDLPLQTHFKQLPTTLPHKKLRQIYDGSDPNSA
ncbi:hypothetical protein LguiA_036565 [Lonicera macranthoides]